MDVDHSIAKGKLFRKFKIWIEEEPRRHTKLHIIKTVITEICTGKLVQIDIAYFFK